MGIEILPTIRVKNPNEDVGFMIINEADFEAETMVLFEEVATEKADLIKQAAELGIKTDGRRSVERLKSAINEVSNG